ncbi:MAG: hypothetical protein GYA61_02905 [Spirochaetales bacterium]|nr:hypothetical protein [Spirochaetales bacterium]
MKKFNFNKIVFISFLIFSLITFIFNFDNKLKADPIIYAEQYYLLYAKSNNFQSVNIEQNIFYLQRALMAPFAPVVQALCKITTQEQYIRYKYLFKMHCNFLIMRSYIQLASRFDKEEVYFYNYLYKEMIIESLKVAKYYYELALPYWQEAIKEANNATTFQKYKIDIPQWEDEQAKILSGVYKYDEIIYSRLENLLKNLAFLENWSDSFNQ